MSRDKPKTNLAVLFADIAKSTHLYDTLGDKSAQRLIGACLSRLEKVTKQHQGDVIKTIGDEIMCVFPSASAAVKAGRAMNRTVDQMIGADKSGLKTLNLYVGIHYGPVIMKKSDVFGDTVNVAARLVTLAKQRQILITEEVVDTLGPELKCSVQCVDSVPLKGKTGEFKVYEAVWEVHDVTMMVKNSENNSVAAVDQTSMVLKHCRDRIEINPDHPSASIGRQPHNDIVVIARLVSRSHARIELRRGKYFLIDNSSNGTYISSSSGRISLLKKDEAQLTGNGVIFLGELADPDSPDAIHFKITR